MFRSGRARIVLLAAVGLGVAAPSQSSADPLAEARALRASPPPAEGRPLVVTDGRTGRALAGASVLLLDRQLTPELQDAAWKIQQGLRDDPTMASLVVAIRFGHKLVTDELGRTVLPASFRGTVHIVAGDCHDHTAASESYEPAVAVFGRRKITVDVVCADGRPAAGVGVELRHVGHVLHDNCGTWCRADTDANGRVRIELPPWTMRDAWSGALVLHAMVCGADASTHAALDPKRYRAGDPGPVQLQLPPLGTLRVTALDAGGKSRSIASVTVMRDKAAHDSVRVTAHEAAAATFLVAPGARYHLYARFLHELGVRELVVPGPDAPGAGAEATFDVRTDPLTAMVRLQHDGRPLDSCQVRCHELDWLGDLGATRPDAEGRVWIALRPAWTALGRLTLSATKNGRALGAVTVSLPDAKAGPGTGLLDLGVATLQQEPVLLAGRVVDRHGAPVADAVVSRCFCNAPAELPVPVRTDADGRFTLRMLNPFPAWVRPLLQYQAPIQEQASIHVSHPTRGYWPAEASSTGEVERFDVGATVAIVLRQ